MYTDPDPDCHFDRNRVLDPDPTGTLIGSGRQPHKDPNYKDCFSDADFATEAGVEKFPSLVFFKV